MMKAEEGSVGCTVLACPPPRAGKCSSEGLGAAQCWCLVNIGNNDNMLFLDDDKLSV